MMNELDEIKIPELKKLMESSELSFLELVDYYLNRIDKIDSNGPKLNSVLEINPEAREIAKKIDSGSCRGVLSGIPILLKGNIDTHDKMATTAGSLALSGNTPKRDALIVTRLREAGAVILGKNNLSEWANFRSVKSSSGWSSIGGQTKNPYILDRSPCGSGSGSGVAVSANLCAAAIGTETDGSIICPSSSNGIVGIKPTLGIVSQKGIIPISHSQDTAGPMARTVGDAALLLSVIAGNSFEIDYKKLTEGVSENLSGKRIGLIKNFIGVNNDVDKLVNDSVVLMKEAGAIIIDTHLKTKGKFDDAEFDVLLYEFKDGINRYLNTCNVEPYVFAPSGYPNITVPAGFIHGLPVGISFFGKAKSDWELIKIAAAFEKISGFRQVPSYTSS